MQKLMTMRGDGTVVVREETDARRFGRICCTRVRCGLGEVLDLSAAGMRVFASRKPKLKPDRSYRLRVQSDVGECEVVAKLVWSHRLGFRKHLLGLRFVEMQEETRRQLNDLARSAPREAFGLLHSLRRS